MRKLLFLIIFFLLTGANSVVVSFVVSDDYSSINMPLADGEENSEEENKNFSEEDDDEVGLGHRWISKEKSSYTDLHFLYQEILFNDLEIEVVIPPPKA